VVVVLVVLPQLNEVSNNKVRSRKLKAGFNWRIDISTFGPTLPTLHDNEC
jgi:hypothetical protein